MHVSWSCMSVRKDDVWEQLLAEEEALEAAKKEAILDAVSSEKSSLPNDTNRLEECPDQDNGTSIYCHKAPSNVSNEDLFAAEIDFELTAAKSEPLCYIDRDYDENGRGNGVLSGNDLAVPTIELDNAGGAGFKNDESANTVSAPGACRFCGKLSGLIKELADLDHYVCFTCASLRKESHGYAMMAQATVYKVYNLNREDLVNYVKGTGKQLVAKELKNPRGYGNNMKLYYQFQILEVCAWKHGSLEAAMDYIEELKDKRLLRNFGSVLTKGNKGRKRLRGADYDEETHLLPSQKHLSPGNKDQDTTLTSIVAAEGLSARTFDDVEVIRMEDLQSAFPAFNTGLLGVNKSPATSSSKTCSTVHHNLNREEPAKRKQQSTIRKTARKAEKINLPPATELYCVDHKFGAVEKVDNEKLRHSCLICGFSVEWEEL